MADFNYNRERKAELESALKVAKKYGADKAVLRAIEDDIHSLVLTTAQDQLKRPDAPLIGANGNIFNLLAIANQVLFKNGMQAEAEEMKNAVLDSESYEDAMNIITDYVNPVEK